MARHLESSSWRQRNSPRRCGLFLQFPPRGRVIFLSRQESNQRSALAVAHRPVAGTLCSSLKPGAVQLASRLRRNSLEQVLAHHPGLSSCARLAPTGERQRQQPRLASAGGLRCSAATDLNVKTSDNCALNGSVPLFHQEKGTDPFSSGAQVGFHGCECRSIGESSVTNDGSMRNQRTPKVSVPRRIVTPGDRKLSAARSESRFSGAT